MNKRQAKKDLKKQFSVSAKHESPRYIKLYCVMLRSKIVENFEQAFLYGTMSDDAIKELLTKSV